MSATLKQNMTRTSAKRTRARAKVSGKNAGEDVSRHDQVVVAEPGGVAPTAAEVSAERERLERERARFQGLLYRQSDDFEATAGLRAAEKALASLPEPDGPWTWLAGIRPSDLSAHSPLRRLIAFLRR